MKEFEAPVTITFRNGDKKTFELDDKVVFTESTTMEAYINKYYRYDIKEPVDIEENGVYDVYKILGEKDEEFMQYIIYVR